jgi:hypothetical protein
MRGRQVTNTEFCWGDLGDGRITLCWILGRKHCEARRVNGTDSRSCLMVGGKWLVFIHAYGLESGVTQENPHVRTVAVEVRSWDLLNTGVRFQSRLGNCVPLVTFYVTEE